MKRTRHDLSFTHSFSADMGYLIPIAAIDVLPGDTFIQKVNMLARVAPLNKPVMHPVQMRVHNWFVPNRILWDDWEEFIVGNDPGHTYPVKVPGATATGTLLDHMGCEQIAGNEYDALPLRAYNKIWNEFYRDQDLSTEVNEDSNVLQRISWGKDYFTTARPNPQQGAAVEVGFSASSAPITGAGSGAGSFPDTDQTAFETDGTAAETYAKSFASNTMTLRVEEDPSNPGYPNLRADLSQATGGIDINELRDAIALQRIAEAREFFGSRYADYLRYYGVSPRDGRLQRPEYLGGGKQMISFSEILSTSDGGNSTVGEMFGHGIASVRQRPVRKMFEEHGWFLTLLSVRPEGMYQNGIPRRFLRRDPTDFWHRELELLPWQSISQQEVYAAGSAETVFGYTPRYDEYRETMNYVSGAFRGGTEEDWTLAREFSAQPTLNESFITCTPSDRIYQSTNDPELLITARNSIKAKRLVSRHARMGNYAGL